jgi:hypothetical protein
MLGYGSGVDRSIGWATMAPGLPVHAGRYVGVWLRMPRLAGVYAVTVDTRTHGRGGHR